MEKNHLLCIFCFSLSTYILIYTHTDTCCVLSCSFMTPWTVARQDPLSMGILQARILEWFAVLSSRGLPNPGIEPRSSVLQANSLLSEPPGKPQSSQMPGVDYLPGLPFVFCSVVPDVEICKSHFPECLATAFLFGSADESP